MWSFSNAINFLFTSIKNFPRIISGIHAYSRDTISEIKELLTYAEPKDMSNGISDILYGSSFGFWASTMVSILSCVLNKFIGVSGTIVGIIIGLLINALILQIMYNHKEGWNPLVTKIFCILVIINITFSAIGILTGILSFSLFGIIKCLGNIISVLAYSLVLKGLLE